MAAPDAPASPFFEYRDGVLHMDGVDLRDVAERFDTPTYVYAPRAVEANFRAIDEALSFRRPPSSAYAVKANGNLAILRRLAALGCGADIVSGGEMARALKAGIPPERIVFSGVGKRDDELRAAMEQGIKSIHVESVGEIDAIEAIAKDLGKKAHIALRVNPDVDPQTHPYIATGLHSTKFGIETDAAEALLPRLVASQHIDLIGVACHIGSQLGSPAPLREAVELLGQFAIKCREAGAPLSEIDVGGGWSMNYGHEETPYPPAKAYGEAIREGLEAAGALELGAQIVTEPGRSIAGDAGVLLTRVIYVKDGARRFIVGDAAMNDLIRPSLYQAYHAVQPVLESAQSTWSDADLVGPVCESGDFLAKGRALPLVKRGDLLVVRGAGAYGREMSSTYNARPLAAEIFVEDGEMREVRARGTHASLWRANQTTDATRRGSDGLTTQPGATTTKR